MSQLILTLLTLTVALSAAVPLADNKAEQAARDALAKVEVDWKPYENRPNIGDPRWKVLMDVLVKVVRAGSVAVPVLEEAAKDGSPWSPSTRDFAAKALKIMREQPDVRDTIAGYDLTKMNSARMGKAAPDFSLNAPTGKSYRLSQFRGKIVILTFVAQDI